jgi:hypothetical protein
VYLENRKNCIRSLYQYIDENSTVYARQYGGAVAYSDDEKAAAFVLAEEALINFVLSEYKDTDSLPYESAGDITGHAELLAFVSDPVYMELIRAKMEEMEEEDFSGLTGTQLLAEIYNWFDISYGYAGIINNFGTKYDVGYVDGRLYWTGTALCQGSVEGNAYELAAPVITPNAAAQTVSLSVPVVIPGASVWYSVDGGAPAAYTAEFAPGAYTKITAWQQVTVADQIGKGAIAEYPETTSHGVPHAWLDTLGLAPGGDYEAADLDDPDGDGFANWQEYVAGSDPKDAASHFRIVSFNDAALTYSPSNQPGRVYTVLGKTNLTDAGSWVSPTNAAHRFFKVKVQLQ